MPVFDAVAAATLMATQAATFVVARPLPRLRALASICALLLGGCTWYHREPLAPLAANAALTWVCSCSLFALGAALRCA